MSSCSCSAMDDAHCTQQIFSALGMIQDHYLTQGNLLRSGKKNAMGHGEVSSTYLSYMDVEPPISLLQQPNKLIPSPSTIYIYSLLPYIAFIVFRLLKTFNCFFPNCNAAGGTSPLCFSCGFGKDNNHVAECTETRLPSRELTYRTFEKWKSSSNISFSRGYLSSQECNSYLFFFRDWLRITTTWGNFLVELPRLKPLLCYQLCCQCTAQAWQDTHGMGLALSQSTRKLPKKRQ